MERAESITIVKALADESRLAIMKSLLERPQYVEELAQRHGLAASTVSFHLRKLQEGGLVSSRKEQYYVVFRTNDEILNTTLRQIVSAHPVGKELQDGRMEEYRRKVLASFFRSGRLEKLPAQHKKRLIVLEQFVNRFEPGRCYTEQEVTSLIQPIFDDYCTIRRLLVDDGMIRREGASYWREGEAVAGAVTAPPPAQEKKARGGRPEVDSRREMKRAYKENAPEAGIYQIRNGKNGRIYVGSSENLAGSRTSRLFQLRMGKVPFSPELQKDLTRFGAESFEFSILAVLNGSNLSDTLERTLASLHLDWLEKLQPFGERGYNSEKAFQREMARR